MVPAALRRAVCDLVFPALSSGASPLIWRFVTSLDVSTFTSDVAGWSVIAFGFSLSPPVSLSLELSACPSLSSVLGQVSSWLLGVGLLAAVV